MSFLEGLRICRRIVQGDPSRNKLLQPPEITIVDAALFKLRNRVVKILRARTQVTAGLGHQLSHLLWRKSAGVGPTIAIDDERNGADAFVLHLDHKPTGRLFGGFTFISRRTNLPSWVSTVLPASR